MGEVVCVLRGGWDEERKGVEGKYKDVGFGGA